MSGKVKAIPDGFHTLTPHIAVSDGHKAIEFYKKAFNAELKKLHLGPDGKSIIHADLKIGDSILMLTDMAPVSKTEPPRDGCAPCTLHLYFEDVDTIYNQAVAAGATATMPLADQFWGDRYGQIVDPFGHNWSLAKHVADLTPEELQKAQKEFFATMCGQAPAEAVATA